MSIGDLIAIKRGSASLFSLQTVIGNLCLLFVAFLLSACDGNYLVWSSDGKLGAVLGAKGLRVCDGEGAISPVLMDKAGMFRWIPQSHQGLIVGYEYTNKWSEIKPLLTAAQEKQIIDEAVKFKRKLVTYHGAQNKFAESAMRTLSYPLEAAIYAHSLGSADFDRMATKKWPAYKNVKVPIFYIKQCQIEAQSVKLGKTLNKSIDEIVELRVSPNGKYLACVKHENAQERNFIELLSISTTEKPAFVASDTNVFPDWSQDSRSLYYTRINNSSEPDLLKGHGVHEGGLFKVDAFDSAGKRIVALKSQRLANIVFDNRAPVHVLKDARVLFLSREVRLPNGVGATPAATLFLLDATKVETVIRRNEDIAYFEPSPEEDQVALSTSSSALLVTKINGSDPVELCNGKDVKVSGLLPQWKSNQDLSYGCEIPAQSKGSKPNYSVMLWTKGGTAARDLSKSWGKEASSEIKIHRDIFQEAMSGVMEDLDRSSGAR